MQLLFLVLQPPQACTRLGLLHIIFSIENVGPQHPSLYNSILAGLVQIVCRSGPWAEACFSNFVVEEVKVTPVGKYPFPSRSIGNFDGFRGVEHPCNQMLAVAVLCCTEKMEGEMALDPWKPLEAPLVLTL